MPLIKGAKPGSKGFKRNIEVEMAAGKPQKQSVAIAYSEARQGAHKMKKEHGKKEDDHKMMHHHHKEMMKHHKKEHDHHMKMMKKHEHSKKK